MCAISLSGIAVPFVLGLMLAEVLHGALAPEVSPVAFRLFPPRRSRLRQSRRWPASFTSAPSAVTILAAPCMSADEPRLGHTATGVACDCSHFASPVWDAGELVLVAPPNGFAAVVAAAFHLDEKLLNVKTRHDSVDVVPVEGIKVAMVSSSSED